MTAAAFLDRDGTLIDDPGFLADPAKVRLLPGVADALRDLAQLGLLRIVITNQSGIGRGLLTTDQVEAVHREIERQLAREGAAIDAWYWCPHRPEEACDCRKPGTLLHRTAAARFDIDLTASWCIGDRIGDVAAAAPLGARGILVSTGDGPLHIEAATAAGIAIAADLPRAVAMLRDQATG